LTATAAATASTAAVRHTWPGAAAAIYIGTGVTLSMSLVLHVLI